MQIAVSSPMPVTRGRSYEQRTGPALILILAARTSDAGPCKATCSAGVLVSAIEWYLRPIYQQKI
eukprot:3364730-Pleurochrysis_carterae.AAC.3